MSQHLHSAQFGIRDARLYDSLSCGQVAEWLKASVSKTEIPATVS
jgi:hypothetical protein